MISKFESGGDGGGGGVGQPAVYQGDLDSSLQSPMNNFDPFHSIILLMKIEQLHDMLTSWCNIFKRPP